MFFYLRILKFGIIHTIILLFLIKIVEILRGYLFLYPFHFKQKTIVEP